MKSLSKNYVVAVGTTWGLTVLLSVSGYLLFIGPQGKAVKQAQEELLSYQQQYSNAHETRSEQVKLEMQKKLRTAQNLKNSLISSSANIAPLTFQISQVGSRLRTSWLGRCNGIGYFVIVGMVLIRNALQLAWPTDVWIERLAWLLVLTSVISMFDRARAWFAATK